MEIGSPEWMQAQAQRIALESDDELLKIAEATAKRYKIDQIQLGQQETARLAMAFNEVQCQSFMLGVQTGLETARRLIQEGAPETPAG